MNKIFQHYFVNFVFCVSVCRYVPMSAEGASNPSHLKLQVAANGPDVQKGALESPVSAVCAVKQ